MKRVDSLSDLFMEELADLLNAEDQLAGALPKMAEACQLPRLKDILQVHLKGTKDQVLRLRDIFSNAGQIPSRVTCRAIKDLVKESEHVINDTQKGQVRDTAITSLAKLVQEYVIARYKAVREHAADLGHTKIVEIFTKALNEERAMSFHLNEISQGMINLQATRGGFYIPEGKFSARNVKKKNKSTDDSRYINEGNPNIQDKNSQNPEEQGDFS